MILCLQKELALFACVSYNNFKFMQLLVGGGGDKGQGAAPPPPNYERPPYIILYKTLDFEGCPSDTKVLPMLLE